MLGRASKLAGWVRRPIVVLFLLSFLPLGAFAQQPDTMPAPPKGAGDGGTAADRRLYFAMWTIHFRDLERGLESNGLLAVSWGRIYGATFINSFGERAYSAGVQGPIARWDSRIVSVGLGYRVGLVTGYDERFIRLAGKTPVLPLLQPLITLDVTRVGLELSYSGVVASAGLNVRL